MPAFLDSVWTLSHFLFGVTYAIFSSIFFLFILLYLFRPSIKIGTEIAEHDDESEGIVLDLSFTTFQHLRDTMYQLTLGYNKQFHRLQMVSMF